MYQKDSWAKPDGTVNVWVIEESPLVAVDARLRSA